MQASERTGAGWEGRDAPDTTRQRAAAARRWNELRGDREGSLTWTMTRSAIGTNCMGERPELVGRFRLQRPRLRTDGGAAGGGERLGGANAAAHDHHGGGVDREVLRRELHAFSPGQAAGAAGAGISQAPGDPAQARSREATGLYRGL